MANNFDSNVSVKLMRKFLEPFEANRVITKSVNTQLLNDAFDASTGDTVYIKRPTDYATIRTADGDISASTKGSIITGRAKAEVQNFFTIPLEWDVVDQALKMDQLDELLAPAATRIITDMELDFANFMMKNAGLSYGTPGTAIDAWSDVAGAGSLMSAIGVPQDMQSYYVMNDFTCQNLASAQNSLTAADGLVSSAWQNAVVSNNLGGMRVMKSNALKTRTTGSLTDRAGAVNGVPTATYVAHKDTMIQDIAVDGFGAGADTILAGEIVEITGKYHLSLATRETILGADGNPIKFRGVVTEDVTLSGGAGTLKVAGPAIQEANGQYNTIDTAIADNDVITVLGAAATTYQPALFYHKQAFGLATVKLPKLHSTDTVATTKDGFSIRVSRYADGDKNLNRIRFDILPAYACFNPFFAGQGFGVA
jgi:hypothetical protein